MAKKTIGIIVGSARKESFSGKVARVIGGFLKDRYEVKELDIAGLALFNQDYDDEGKTPPEWAAFRAEVKALDAALFVTPEYNRSFTPLLKNAIDIASRPLGQNVWNGKPGAIVGVSPGALGGALAVNQLKQPLAFLGVDVMPQPEVYLGGAGKLFDEKGALANPDTEKFLKSFADAFASWVLK